MAAFVIEPNSTPPQPTHPLTPRQGNVTVVGRKSPYSLYDPVIASFEDDQGLYNQVCTKMRLPGAGRQGG